MDVDVILYHQDSCPQCKMVEMMLNKNGIKYTSCKDIEEMKNLGLLHTPALGVEGKILQGKEIFEWIGNH